jgi:hypothetical protein
METLSPQIIEIRDQIIEQLNDLTLEECSKKLKELFNQETNDFYKLGNLAARVITLKKRINLILNDSNEDNQNVLKNETKKSKNIIENIMDGKPENTANESDWVRVQIKETAEVNGVRFPAGIQIDVTNEDSRRMIESGKAILLDHKEQTD